MFLNFAAQCPIVAGNGITLESLNQDVKRLISECDFPINKHPEGHSMLARLLVESNFTAAAEIARQWLEMIGLEGLKETDETKRSSAHLIAQGILNALKIGMLPVL